MEEDTPVFNTLEEELTHYRSLSQSLSTTLEDTRSALEDFQTSSKELEYELERELASTEVREKELRTKVDRLTADVDDWKNKYQTAVRENASSMTKMQKELETLRSTQQSLKAKLRDMENDNDELEKSERAMETTLQDLEQRHDRAIERATLLEDELINKAQLEEEMQRVKDELRDTTEELAVFRGYKDENDSLKKDMSALHAEVTHLRATVQEQESQLHLSRTIRAASPPVPNDFGSRLTRPPSNNRNSNRLSTVSANSDDVFSDKDRDESTPKKVYSNGRERDALAEINPPPTTFAPSPSPTRRIPSSLGSRLPISPSRIPSPSMRSTTTTPLTSSTVLPRSKIATGIPGVKSAKEKRAESVLKEMKTMTEKMKTMTARLDSRRTVRPGIPVPRTSGTGLQRTNSKKEVFSSSVAPRTSFTSSRMESSKPSLSNTISGKSSPIDSVAGSSNPRRSSLHMSVAASSIPPSAAVSNGVSAKTPRRSRSRLSSVSTSRPTTPAAPTTRSPTPSESSNLPSHSLASKRSSAISTASDLSKRSSFSTSSPLAIEDLSSSILSLSSSTTTRLPSLSRRKSVNSAAATALPILKQSTNKEPLNQSTRPRSGTSGDIKQLSRWK